MENKWVIDGVDFFDMEAERFWNFTKNYRGDKKAETKEMILSTDYTGSLKKDGHYYRLVKSMNGDCALVSRSLNVNGVYTDKIGHIPHLNGFLKSIPKGTCMTTEIYIPNGTSRVTQTIMGCGEEKAIQRQEDDNNWVHMYIFDIYAFDGESLMHVPHEERTTIYMDKLAAFGVGEECVQFAKFYEGETLAEKIEIALEQGEEGFVLVRKGSLVEPGKRPARKTLKIKKELADDIDVFFTGAYKKPTREYTGTELESWQYWENVKTGEKLEGDYFNNHLLGEPIEPVTKPYFLGMAGSLQIGCLRGKEIHEVGFVSGLEDWIKLAVVENPEKIAMKPITVTAMQFTHTGKLRHPVFVGFREDLTLEDCSYEKIFS